MNKEEILNKYIDLIDKGYCCACNELNCIDNFPHSKIARAIRELQQENEKLKADYGTQAQIERDMLQQENKILKENAENNDKVVDKVNWENMLLKKENQELKKQLEEYKDKINWYENFEVNKTIDKLRLKHNVQQKEFIKYLEDNWKQTQDIWYIKILQKYKEIVEEKHEI